MLTPEHKNAWIAIIYARKKVRKLVNQSLINEDCLPIEDYDVLLHLDVSGEAGMDMGSLADSVQLTLSGMSRMIDRLREGGFVWVERSAKNHRVKIVRITNLGLEMREKSWEIYSKVVEVEFASAFSREEAAVIAEALNRVSPVPKIGWVQGS